MIIIATSKHVLKLKNVVIFLKITKKGCALYTGVHYTQVNMVVQKIHVLDIFEKRQFCHFFANVSPCTSNPGNNISCYHGFFCGPVARSRLSIGRDDQNCRRCKKKFLSYFFPTLNVPSFHPYELRAWNRLGCQWLLSQRICLPSTIIQGHIKRLQNQDQYATNYSLVRVFFCTISLMRLLCPPRPPSCTN